MGSSANQATQAPAPTSQPSTGLGPAVNNYNPTMGTGYELAVVTRDPANTPLSRPQPQQPQMVQPTGPNIFQQSSGALGQAQQTLTGLSEFQPQPMQAAQLGPAATMQGVGAVQAAQAPDQIEVNQLATTDIGQYMSPYQQQVIEAGQADIERQRQMASENLAAQAQRAGAFGGSRQAVQEGVLAGEALRQAGQLSAQQRQRGFETALQSGQFDIGQTQAARTLASQQGFQAEQLGQQAREAAAAREQAARAGNMQAANQFATQQAQLEQAANQANYQGQFTGAGIRQGAASGLSGLGGQMFGIGQQVQGAIGQQGQFQRGLQQQLLDRAMGQYGGATGAPMAGLGALTSVLSGVPYGSTTTSRTPFNPLGLLGAFI